MGRSLLTIVAVYRQKHGIKEVALPSHKDLPEPSPNSAADNKPSATDDSKQISYDLRQKGLTIAKIAEERGLATSTIEAHLTTFIADGKLAIGKLLAADKQQAIEQTIAQQPDQTWSEIKKALGDDYSYGEIKMVLAHLEARGDLPEMKGDETD